MTKHKNTFAKVNHIIFQLHPIFFEKRESIWSEVQTLTFRLEETEQKLRQAEVDRRFSPWDDRGWLAHVNRTNTVIEEVYRIYQVNSYRIVILIYMCMLYAIMIIFWDL